MIKWPKDEMAKDKITNNNLQTTTQKTKDRATRMPPKNGGELVCSGRISSSCSTNDTRLATLVTNPMIYHEWWRHQIMITKDGTYLWSFVTHIFRNQIMVATVKLSKWWLQLNNKEYMFELLVYAIFYFDYSAFCCRETKKDKMTRSQNWYQLRCTAN